MTMKDYPGLRPGFAWEVVDFGRPRFIRLAVLVDRGGREYPISADFVGRRLEIPDESRVRVSLKPIDSDDAVVVNSAAPTAAGVGL